VVFKCSVHLRLGVTHQRGQDLTGELDMNTRHNMIDKHRDMYAVIANCKMQNPLAKCSTGSKNKRKKKKREKKKEWRGIFELVWWLRFVEIRG